MAQASAEKLEQTGPAEKERVATRRAVGKNAGAALAKRKRNRAPSRAEHCPEHQIMSGERVKVSESRTLVRERERGGSEREHGEERVDFMANEGRFLGGKRRACKKSLPRIGRRKHERVSGCKSSPGRSAESWFHS